MTGCPTCGRNTPLTIRMHVAGHHVTFQRCEVCEANTWTVDTELVGLADVCDLTRSDDQWKGLRL